MREWNLRVTIGVTLIGVLIFSWVLFGVDQFTDWRAWFFVAVLYLTFHVGWELSIREYKKKMSSG